MPSRLPTASDFSPNLDLAIVPPPVSQEPVNILLLLHGLGDTYASFTNLARQLSLPETACIALQAPTPLPFELGGFHWGDDIIFDQDSGQMDFDTGFLKATKILGRDTLQDVLMKHCGYQPREIVILGYGQGGMAALAASRSLTEELGGIVSIGGPLPSFNTGEGALPTSKNRTPLLVLGGSSKTLVTDTALTRLRSAFDFVEYKRWNKAGDSMPRNREEMLPIMQFFARRLRSRRGVPKGSVEIG